MIAYLNGTIVDKTDHALVVDVNGVGYEVFCARNIMDVIGAAGSPCRLFVHTQYRSDGASLFGFSSMQEKNLFLSLIKVDSVGPKSALNIMSGASWIDIAHFIEDGDVAGLAKLPKVSKKTAEHLVVKLKGKLSELFFVEEDGTNKQVQVHREKSSASRKLRGEAQTALSHLGYKPIEIERAFEQFADNIWQGDLQIIIRHALNILSGNI